MSMHSGGGEEGNVCRIFSTFLVRWKLRGIYVSFAIFMLALGPCPTPALPNLVWPVELDSNPHHPQPAEGRGRWKLKISVLGKWRPSFPAVHNGSVMTTDSIADTNRGLSKLDADDESVAN